MAEAALKYIEGVCNGVEQKPGNEWVTFSVAVAGRQYPYKLQTKRKEIVDKALAVGAQHATWKYNEVESQNVNPRSGHPYTNRYLEDVRVGSHTPAGYVDESASSGSTGGGGDGGSSSRGGQYSEDDIARFEAKERRDFRSRAWGQTVSLFSPHVTRQDLMSDEERQHLFVAMQAMQRKIYIDITESFAFPDIDNDPNLPSEAGAESGSGADDGWAPNPVDDDIPF